LSASRKGRQNHGPISFQPSVKDRGEKRCRREQATVLEKGKIDEGDLFTHIGGLDKLRQSPERGPVLSLSNKGREVERKEGKGELGRGPSGASEKKKKEISLIQSFIEESASGHIIGVYSHLCGRGIRKRREKDGSQTGTIRGPNEKRGAREKGSRVTNYQRSMTKIGREYQKKGKNSKKLDH